MLAARLADAVAPVFVARRDRPTDRARPPGSPSTIDQRLDRREMRRRRADRALPLRLRRPERDEQRVVEVEQDRARQCHASVMRSLPVLAAPSCQNSGSWPKKMRAPPRSSASSRSSEASIASRSYTIARQAPLAQGLAEIAGIGGEHDVAAVEPHPQRLVPRRVAVRRQADDRAVAEHVVLAIDEAQFVAEVEIARVEAAPRGGVGVHPGIPLAALHQHRRVRDQRVAADMVEMEMRVDDEVDLAGSRSIASSRALTSSPG